MNLKLYHHLIFTPKYRLAFMADPVIHQEAEKWIRRGAELRGVQVHALSVMPDHVHICISTPTGVSLARAVWMMKWLPSIQIRKRHPELKRHRAFWGRHYWARTIGNDLKTVEKYIHENIP